MDDSTLEDRLSQLGFSEKEADTYIAILKQGEAKASEIADAAGVSKRYVYSISEKLEDRGFVEVNDHVVPTTIRAAPPEEVVGTITEELREMETALSERYSIAERETQQFDVIKSRVTVIKQIAEYIADAENEITLTVPHEHFPEVAPRLREATERGVLSLVLVTDVTTGELDDEGIDGVGTVVRAWDQPTPIMLTVDQRYGIVAPAEMVTRTNSGQRAIALAQEQIVPVFVGSFLGNYWPMATEVHVADPRPLPATYDNFRQAVLDATLYLDEGSPVRARAEVTPVRDAPERSYIEGPVLETKQGLVEPRTNTFLVEHSLVVEVDGERVTLGGPGSFLEAYEASEVVLEAE